jgi:hypothetical protein
MIPLARVIGSPQDDDIYLGSLPPSSSGRLYSLLTNDFLHRAERISHVRVSPNDSPKYK